MAKQVLPMTEFTLRSYGSIGELTGRDLVKTICMSLGLLQAKDRRDIIVDVFHCLSLAQKRKESLSSIQIGDEVIKSRTEHKLDQKGTAGSNIRRILKELMDFGLIERESSKYRFVNFDDPADIFQNIVEDKLRPIVSRNIQYLRKL